MMLTANYTMDHYNEAALPALIHSAADSPPEVRRTVEGSGAILLTGHGPEEWPNFKKVPDYYG
jgi:N-acyl homoserine lactone hydrolase